MEAFQTSRSQLKQSFDKSVSAAQVYSNRAYIDYIIPFSTEANEFAHRHPARALLLAIFLSLSFLPVTAFLLFSSLLIAFFIFASLSFAIFVASTIITGLGICLVGLLVAFFFLSVFFTSVIIGLHMVVRLVVSLRAEGSVSDGVRQWATDTTVYIVPESKTVINGNSGVEDEQKETETSVKTEDPN